MVATAILCFASSSLFGQPPGGGPNAPDVKLLDEYDKDGDGVLNTSERQAARKALASRTSNRGRRGPRGRSVPGKPGPKVAIEDAQVYPNAGLYDQSVLRTFFLEFDFDDWEQELAAFKPTDVEIPAKLIVDGVTYPNVGVSFRGASSFFMIPEGSKRSLNLSLDFMNKEQRLYGYKSLNLLNCNGDASMMSSILYSHLANQRIAAPKVNYVKVVINGESWGVYVSSQQFNNKFVEENFPIAATGNSSKDKQTGKGARWKVPGSPGGRGGLEYLGEEIEPYRERFEIKSKDKESSWKDLIQLCRVLNETPLEKLPEAIEPILDVEGALWFLALDVALVNSDGYWTRASDYNIYQDTLGKFHILPHDMNEALTAGQHGPGGGGPPRGVGGRPGFPGPPPGGGPNGGARPGRPGQGPEFGPPPGGPQGGPNDEARQRGRRGRGGGGPRGGGVDLDPLVGVKEQNTRTPLRSVLLSHPEYRKQYLENLKTIAEMIAWENLEPIVDRHRDLIESEVAKDTRKLFTTSDFRESKAGLKEFAQKRSAFLLKHEQIRDLE